VGWLSLPSLGLTLHLYFYAPAVLAWRFGYLAGAVASAGVLGVGFSRRGVCIVRNDACNPGDSDHGDGV